MSLLDDAFELLDKATKLDDHGGEKEKVEAATKYYEATYLMKRYLQRIPRVPAQEKKISLLEDKIAHYDDLASKCLVSPLSSPSSQTTRRNISAPKSETPIPMAQAVFFDQDAVPSVVVPIMPPEPSIEAKKPHHSTIDNQMANQAHLKMSQAMDYEELGKRDLAMEAYKEAAQIYLQVVKAAEKNSVNAKSIVGILNQVLDRLEELKEKENSVKSQPQSQQPRSQLQNKAVVDKRVEKPKKAGTLTEREILILKRSSLIASGVFLPWSDQDANELNLSVQNSRPTTVQLFTDPKGDLQLAKTQRDQIYAWARPGQILDLRGRGRQVGAIGGQPCMVLKAISPYNILQHGVTDCSFVASLCICAAYERRFRKRLITNIVYPQTPQGQLLYNPAGKYMVKLWLNGVARLVVVDDKLPVDQHGRLLCAHTKCPPNQLELWVSIIEKAYMKLCGGYDFPGSNSGVDLYSLTGWIPERIIFPRIPNKVRDHETPPERAWERLLSASSYGDCLITMSSEASMTREQEIEFGLITGHAYAVLSVIQTSNGTRLLQLKNPWANKGWKGRYSCHDSASWSDPKFRAEVGYNPEVAKKQDDGVFWICWEDILIYYQNIHLSWNPSLFAYHETAHGFWPKDQGPFDDTFNCGENPQYILELSEKAIQKKATVWILISRHVTKQEQAGSEVQEFLTVHLHRNDKRKERVWYSRSKQCVLNGAYTNNPHCLVRYDIDDPADAYISVVLSQFEKEADLAYTLSCFCTEAFSLVDPMPNLRFNTEVSSSWDHHNAGGPIGTKDFYMNPNIPIRVPQGGATLQFQCMTTKSTAINIIVVPILSFAHRVAQITAQPPIDSGNYRHGFLVTERKQVAAGNYMVIVSNYKAGQTGVFKVNVFSSAKLDIGSVM